MLAGLGVLVGGLVSGGAGGSLGGGRIIAGVLSGGRFQGRALKDRHIADLVQIDTAHGACIVGGEGVALHIGTGGGAGVRGHCGKVAVALGLPVDGLEGHRIAAVLDALGDILRVLVSKARVGAGGGHGLGGTAIPGHLHLYCVQLQGQHPGQSILRNELLCLGQQGKHRAHVLTLAVHGHGFRVLAALIGGEFLFQQVGEGVVVAVLVKIGPGDASGVILRSQVIHLPDLAAVLAPGDSSGVTGGWLGGLRRSGCKGGGSQTHR